MGRIRALPLLIGAVAAGLLVSGASGADPSTPPPLPGRPAPFLGTAVLGDGRLLGAVDAYGDLVDLRYPGPAGEAQISDPYLRQAAGTVPADTGLVPAAAAAGRPPRPLWRATRLRQRYLPDTNVLRTVATVAGARVMIDDAVDGERVGRRIAVHGPPGERLALRLGVNLDLDGDAAGDAISSTPTGFVQRDGTAVARCRVTPHAGVRTTSGNDVKVRLAWTGRGALHAGLACGFGQRPLSVQRLDAEAVAAGRHWLARRLPLGPRAPIWARRIYARSLLVLRALSDRGGGAVAAGARDRWAYVWPRDAGTAAIALADSGYRADARRIVGFLAGLDLDAGARFRADSSAVDGDGRASPGDSAGWVAAAARAAGVGYRAPRPGAWRERGDYGERDDDRGDYLANAIAGRASAAQIGRLFGAPFGLERRAGDPGSGLDSAAAWAVRPFPRPALFASVRKSLASLEARAGRYGLRPSQDWPHRQAWTAPAAWCAWSLAALGQRAAALSLLARLRRASTPLGTIPERVSPADGRPLSTTPLGWTHSFAILALRQLYPR